MIESSDIIVNHSPYFLKVRHYLTPQHNLPMAVVCRLMISTGYI